VIVPLSAQVAAVFDASESAEYAYVDASDADVQNVNRAMLIAAHEMIISKTPDVFPKELLDQWATATPDDRVELLTRLPLQRGA
jgi:hypothetical protein